MFCSMPTSPISVPIRPSAGADPVLLAVAAADGKPLAELQLPDAPVFDGLIAAQSRLFLATRNGKVLCLAGK